MATPRHLTKTEIALQVLRERLRAGELAPGSRLRVEELANDLQMSPTPVREALRLLQADGLVDYRAHHGIVVSELSEDVIHDLFRLRTVLEPLATELAVPRLGPDDLAKLERLHEQQVSAVAAKRGSAIAQHNSAWHWTLYDAAASPLLHDFLRRLWEVFPWRTIWALPGRPEQSLAQHEALMVAIREGDAAGAARLMREHVASGETTLLEHASETSAL
jgi:DNA-binding GntR family transcriptional regulator